MFGLGWPEVLVILGVVVLVFGSKRIPEIGSALGKTLKGFKEEFDSDAEAAPKELSDHDF